MSVNRLVLKLEPKEEICEENIAEFDALLVPQENVVFSCSQCDLAFTSDQHLQEHTTRALEEQKFPSSSCAYVAKNKNDLNRHERLVHKGEGRNYACVHCNKTFPKNSKLERHIRTHTGEKPFVCSVCAKRFAQKVSLTKHQLIHSGERPFACKKCGQCFVQLNHLRTHQRIHTGEKPYKCKWCDYKCNRSSDLTKHERKHTDREKSSFETAGGNQFLMVKLEPQEEICEESIAELDALIDPQEKDVFGCSQCDLAFTSDQLLQEHARRAHEGRNFPSSVCAYVAKSSNCLKKHEREEVHRGRKADRRNYVCVHCNKAFTDNSKLENHVRTHTGGGEKPFVCKVCAKGFSEKGNLNKHQLIHSGERPFACKECGQRFNQQGNLMSHQRIHTGEKPFVCSVCAKGFCAKDSLKKHQRLHSAERPFGCKVCGQSFTQLCNLTTHQRIHTGEKPYKCKWCDKRFNQSTHLTVHERTHTGEKPYECKMCSYRSTTSGHIHIHECKVHHM